MIAPTLKGALNLCALTMAAPARIRKPSMIVAMILMLYLSPYLNPVYTP